MTNLLATALAGLAVLLGAVALYGMTVGNLQLAGFCFLSVSVVLYLRETRAVDR
jgi:membrane protein implicated in regulation of membrane protease activity